jgi:hypothetical protein
MKEHQASIHSKTNFEDKPESVVIAEFAKQHPDCTIVNTTTFNGAVKINYTRNSEVEEARRLTEQPDVCVGNMDDDKMSSQRPVNRGIQL